MKYLNRYMTYVVLDVATELREMFNVKIQL